MIFDKFTKHYISKLNSKLQLNRQKNRKYNVSPIWYIIQRMFEQQATMKILRLASEQGKHIPLQ